MRITFTPQSRFDTLALSKQGDVLTINEEVYDFAELADGDSVILENSWVVWSVSRVNGEVQITLACPSIYENVVVHPEDGPIAIPVQNV